MKCEKCGGQVLIENVGDKRTKVTCQACGWSEVRDNEGRRMLTEVPESHGSDKARLLTEDWP